MMNKIDTDIIETRIQNAKSYDEFYEKSGDTLLLIHPGEYILNQIKDRKLKKNKVIAAVNINAGYTYEILRLEKRPVRSKMLQFVFALGMDISETQTMLKRCGYAQLYGKNPRDSIIMFCISRRKNLIETNMLLHKYKYNSL